MDQVDAVLTRLAAGPVTQSSAFLTLKSPKAAPELQVGRRPWCPGVFGGFPNARGRVRLARAHSRTQAAASHVAQALQEFEAIAAAAAVDAALPPTERDVRPCVTIKVTGHLFDKAVLNRLVDLAVDSDCEFRVRTAILANAGGRRRWINARTAHAPPRRRTGRLAQRGAGQRAALVGDPAHLGPQRGTRQCSSLGRSC